MKDYSGFRTLNVDSKIITFSVLLLLTLTFSGIVLSSTVVLDDINQYSAANTARGTYIHYPDSISVTPYYSLTSDLLWFLGTSIVVSSIENLDIYSFLLASGLHGITPLTIDRAIQYNRIADIGLTMACFWGVCHIQNLIPSQKNTMQLAMSPLSVELSLASGRRLEEFEIAEVYTGQPLFDRQVRMTLLKPAAYNISQPEVTSDEADDFDGDWDDQPESKSAVSLKQADEETDYGYSNTFLHLAPTPFQYKQTLDANVPTGRLVKAMNLLDRGEGDELLMGRNHDGDFFIAISSPASEINTLVTLEGSSRLYRSKYKSSDPKAMSEAMAPVVFLFSDGGSRFVSEALHCLYKQECSGGYLESVTVPEFINAEATVYNHNRYSYHQFTIGTTPLANTPHIKKRGNLAVNRYDCRRPKDRADCAGGVFWPQDDTMMLPKLIRVVEGEQEIRQYIKTHKRSMFDHLIHLFHGEYPYSYSHPDQYKRIMMVAFLICPTSNPLKPLFRTLHRKLLLGLAKKLISVPAATSVALVVPAASGIKGITRDITNTGKLAPVKADSPTQFHANLKALIYYSDGLRNSMFNLFWAQWLGQSYVEKARVNLYGYRPTPGNYLIPPDIDEGLRWLANGFLKQDHASIKMLLELNEFGHFISLSPKVTNALQLLIKPGKKQSGKRSGRAGSSGQARSLWRQQLNEAYQEAAKEEPTPARRKPVNKDEPEAWNDSDFMKALNKIEKDEKAFKTHQTKKGGVTKDSSAHLRGRAFRRTHGQGATSSQQNRQAAHDTVFANRAAQSSTIKICSRGQTRTQVIQAMQRHQWVNKILTRIENSHWHERIGDIIKTKQVKWQGQLYHLYHLSMGEDLQNNEGNMATVFYIRVNDEAVVIAAGFHPKATVQNPQVGKLYNIMWQHDDFQDDQIKTGKQFKLK